MLDPPQDPLPVEIKQNEQAHGVRDWVQRWWTNAIMAPQRVALSSRKKMQAHFSAAARSRHSRGICGGPAKSRLVSVLYRERAAQRRRLPSAGLCGGWQEPLALPTQPPSPVCLFYVIGSPVESHNTVYNLNRVKVEHFGEAAVLNSMLIGLAVSRVWWNISLRFTRVHWSCDPVLIVCGL